MGEKNLATHEYRARSLPCVLSHVSVLPSFQLEVESERTSESNAFPVWFPTTFTSHSPDGTGILKPMAKKTNAFKHRLNCFY